MNKTCTQCDESLPSDSFYVGRNKCIKCYRRHQRTRDRTVEGHIKRIYGGMKHRVSGGLLRANMKFNGRAHGAEYYVGLPLIAKDEFLTWSLQDPEYRRLHNEWVDSGFERRLTPSIDRIDSRFGYLHPNIEWVSLSENCKNINLFRST